MLSMSKKLGFGLMGLVVLAGTAGANIVTYTATLNGANEAPPNNSPGIGFAQVDYDLALHSMRVRATFSGLQGNTTASHIHSATAVPGQGTAPVATQTPSFTGFPLGVTAGSFDNTFDMTLASSYNASFITAHGGTVASAEAFFLQSLDQGTAYLNIHTSVVPGGEIRGFLVPGPGAASVICFGGLAAFRRRR